MIQITLNVLIAFNFVQTLIYEYSNYRSVQGTGKINR